MSMESWVLRVASAWRDGAARTGSWGWEPPVHVSNLKDARCLRGANGGALLL